MGALFQRKTAMIMAWAFSLAATLIVLASDENLRDRLGTTYWLLGLAIIGSLLLVLAGYVWDRTLMDRLREIKRTANTAQPFQSVDDEGSPFELPDEIDIIQEPDEIIGLARQIERMAQSLQKVEASYRGIVADQIDLTCRYRADGTMTFVNAAFAKFHGKRRKKLLGQTFPLFDLRISQARLSGKSSRQNILRSRDERSRWREHQFRLDPPRH
ncbi:MAG: hypothetical protein J6386_00580 [Candidatus Synoicihabitans palmerolidicus]|nr:hypothetical protein [Candidatus Synoicihabitans palmerolidicus]